MGPARRTGPGDGRTERGAFGALIDALANDSLKKVTASTGMRGQVVVDILILNLFERTADIGFLATDRDLCLFLSGGTGAPDGAAIGQRLRRYRANHSAYGNVVVLDGTGQVLAAADPAVTGHVAEPMVDATRAAGVTTDGCRIATFAIGDHRLALPCAAVVEAIVPEPIARIAGRRDTLTGYADHDGRGIPVLDPRPHVGLPPGTDPSQPLIVVRTARGTYGLAVDMLGEVAMVAPDRIQPTGLGGGVRGMIHPGNAGPAITLLDADALIAALLTGEEETAMPARRAA